jgi:cytochrome c peroxidase
MSFAGRSFPHLGKKMLRLRPLARQIVHPEDSVLGSLSAARFDAQGTLVGRRLRTTYPALIRAAFHDKYWNSTQPITLGSEHFSQMEANFSLFFGLAILMYESTLVSDDTPFDRFQEGDNTALTAQQQIGLNTFIREGQCMACHRGSEFTNATVNDPLPRPLEGIVERMDMALGEAFYDNGFYNIGVRPTGEDLGRGGTAPFINPATDEPFPLSFTRLALLEDNGFPLPFSIQRLPCGNAQPSPCPLQRAAVDGAFKTPGLRNVELTGPYFHNGGQATLRQVVKFYARGEDFHDQNLDNLDPNIDVLVGLHGQPAKEVALVDFLLALTDDRVRFERAPFDHPEIFPNGSPGNHTALRCAAGSTCDSLFKIPPVGASGRSTPIRTFLGIDPFQP